MAWLRLDDGFDTHPKLLELTEVQRWRWTRVLLHCARHRTEGTITKSALTELGLGRAIHRLINLGLLDQEADGYVVHDWANYNAATIAERVKSFLETNPLATANQVHQAIGGTRNIVLAEVAKQRSNAPRGGSSTGTAEPPAAGTAPVRPNQPGGTESGSVPGTESVLTRADPSPEVLDLTKAVALGEDPEPSLDDDSEGDAAYDENGTAWDFESLQAPTLREMP